MCFEARFGIYCCVFIGIIVNKIGKIFIILNVVCFFKEIYMVIKYLKLKYGRGFLMFVRNRIEIYVVLNEFIFIIKIFILVVT